MHLPFDMTLAPRQPDRFSHGVQVPFKSSREAGQGGPSCSFKPAWERLHASFTEDAEEVHGKLCDSTDLG
jgi:hypothetical protein